MQAFPPINQNLDFQLLVDPKLDLAETDEAEVSDQNAFALLLSSLATVQPAPTKAVSEVSEVSESNHHSQSTAAESSTTANRRTSIAGISGISAIGGIADSVVDQSLPADVAERQPPVSLETIAIPTNQPMIPEVAANAFVDDGDQADGIEIVSPDTSATNSEVSAIATEESPLSSSESVFSSPGNRESLAATRFAGDLQDAIQSFAKPQPNSAAGLEKPITDSTLENFLPRQADVLIQQTNAVSQPEDADTNELPAVRSAFINGSNGLAELSPAVGLLSDELQVASVDPRQTENISPATEADFQPEIPVATFSFNSPPSRNAADLGFDANLDSQTVEIGDETLDSSAALKSVEPSDAVEQVTHGPQAVAAHSTVAETVLNNSLEDDIEQEDGAIAVNDGESTVETADNTTVVAEVNKPQRDSQRPAFASQTPDAIASEPLREFRRPSRPVDSFQNSAVSESASQSLLSEASGLTLQAVTQDATAVTESMGVSSAARSSQMQTMQSIVNELVAESGAVSDSKTMTVRFEDPHIGSVQLEISKTDSGMSVSVAAGDELTLEMLSANSQQFERSLKDNQIELLEIVSLQMNTATSDQGHPNQAAHREVGSTYRSAQSTGFTSANTTDSKQESATTLNFRA